MFIRSKLLRAVFAIALAFLPACGLLFAQSSGPMQPPESTKFPTPPPPSKPEAPPMPPEEIIRRFAAKEDEMVRAIRGYTFQRNLRIQEIGADGRPSGQLEVVTQLRFSPDGKLFEKLVSRQPSTLHILDLQRGDSTLLPATPMFPLTTAMLPKYQITYGGKQPLDDLSTYFFTIKPRALDRAFAYFSGVVWVDEQDLVIVKTMGKWVTELGDVTSSDLPFAVFETQRQQVGKNFWFPAYARSDENIPSGDKSVPVRAVIKWSEFTPQAASPADDTPPPLEHKSAAPSP